MNQWRSFFANLNTDIWTVIEKAIVVAATDYPKEFKNRRSDIAETLFSRTLLRLSSGDADATRLSGSGITNANNLEENGVGDDGDEAEDAREGFSTRVTPISNDEEALEEHMEEKTSVAKELYRIKEMLQHSDQSEQSLLELIQRLQNLQVTVEVLKETEIGRQVNILRKHHSKRVRSSVKLLVSGWKDLVDEWVKTVEDDATAAIAGNGATALRANGVSSSPHVEGDLLAASTTSAEINQTISYADEEAGFAGYRESNHKEGYSEYPPLDHGIRDHSCISMKSLSRSTQTCYAKNDYTSNTISNFQGCRGVEERGSSNVDYDCPDRIERRPESDSRHSTSHHRSTSLGTEYNGRFSTAGFHSYGQGRPDSEARKMKLNGSSVVEINVGKSWKPSTANKPIFTQDFQTAEKLELSKRKLHEGYQQAENAKKQRTAQRLDILDLPKEGDNQGKIKLNGQSKPPPQNWHRNQIRK